MTVDRLETELADKLGVAIAAGGGEPMVALDGEISLATRLESFLASALERHPDWSRYWWVDDLDCVLRVPGPRAVEVQGILTWVDGDGWFIDPVLGFVQLADTLRQIESYEVRFGDAAMGIGRVAFDTSPPPSWKQITDWLIVVAGERYPA